MPSNTNCNICSRTNSQVAERPSRVCMNGNDQHMKIVATVTAAAATLADLVYGDQYGNVGVVVRPPVVAVGCNIGMHHISHAINFRLRLLPE